MKSFANILSISATTAIIATSSLPALVKAKTLRGSKGGKGSSYGPQYVGHGHDGYGYGSNGKTGKSSKSSKSGSSKSGKSGYSIGEWYTGWGGVGWGPSSSSSSYRDDTDSGKAEISFTSSPSSGPTRRPFPPLGNEFQHPRVRAERSPCPAINTLANHGFINRNGKGINTDELAEALEKVYRVRGETLIQGPIRAAIELSLTKNIDGDVCTEDDETCFLDLDTLFEAVAGEPDGAQEHDSSFVREDVLQDGVEFKLPSLDLIESLFNATGREILQPYEIMQYQRQRIQNSCERRQGMTLAPGVSSFADELQSGINRTRTYTQEHRGGMAIQGSLLFVLAQQLETEPAFTQLNKENLLSILRDERLPANFHPDANRFFEFNSTTNLPSDDFRDAFRQNVETAICAFCVEDVNFCDLELARLVQPR